MKVQKIVSLTPHTAKLSEEIPNFSAFVRSCLLNRYEEEAFQRETMLRIKWKRAADYLAETIIEIYKELGQEIDQTAEELTTKALQQTRLEDFQ